MYGGPEHLKNYASVETKVRELLKRMTTEEKVAQLGSAPAWELIENGKFSQDKAERLLGKGIGQITRVAGTSGIGPKEVAIIGNQIQRFLVEKTRLGIPAVIHEECLSGLMAMGATTFPQAIGLASTWDEELVQRITSAIREQMRATGASQGLSPVLDIARDPRWGRTEETFGEDPYLVARIGTAYVKGLQGENPRSGVLATVKHFAAHGVPEGGRNCAPVHVSPRELREVFLFPFEAAVKEARTGSLMNAYHEIDGVPCASSRYLLTEVLREEWGFRGFVVSDYGAVKMLQTFHQVAGSEKEAAIMALEAGIDIELPSTQCYGEPLIQAVKDGLVSESTLNEAVSRVLRAKILLGLFENPYVDAELAPMILDRAEHRELALQAARESIVLLKNEGILPLNKSIGSIAVVGPNADSTRNLLGDYSYTAHLSCKRDAVPIVSILEGIRKKLPKANIHYAKGCEIKGSAKEGFGEALEAARESEVIISVVGERSGLSQDDVSGEGRDRSDLGLPGVQEELVKALCETGKPVIVVLVNGRPLSIGWIAENCHAIVEAWLPGEEGGNAVADVLFGDYNPGGRLPISVPPDVGQIPVNYGRKPSSYGNYVFSTSKPLFPFGHGLSYTKFEYSSLKIVPEKVGPAGKVMVGFEVKNVGDRKGDEVVQLYVSDRLASVSRPSKELKGFKRISLDRNEKKAVEFHLFTEQLSFYDRYMRFVIEPGKYDVMVGSSSEEIKLVGSFEVVGDGKVIHSRRVFFSDVYVS
jgi:beta-glucosidase